VGGSFSTHGISGAIPGEFASFPSLVLPAKCCWRCGGLPERLDLGFLKKYSVRRMLFENPAILQRLAEYTVP
jgi:hypothetical protein